MIPLLEGDISEWRTLAAVAGVATWPLTSISVDGSLPLDPLHQPPMCKSKRTFMAPGEQLRQTAGESVAGEIEVQWNPGYRKPIQSGGTGSHRLMVVTAEHVEQVNDISPLSTRRGKVAKSSAVNASAPRSKTVQRRRRRAIGLAMNVRGSAGSKGRPHSGQTGSGMSRRRYPHPRHSAASGTLMTTLPDCSPRALPGRAHGSALGGAREKGVRMILPERPEGCFAQNHPDAFFPSNRPDQVVVLLAAAQDYARG